MGRRPEKVGASLAVMERHGESREIVTTTLLPRGRASRQIVYLMWAGFGKA